ncbi:acyltransferase family protein [Novosphingobium flavum]|uniref:Acyltransferase family protein n=1 Tax=Novosphingobium flavum TaxID=1778672 RepID=A0A7X1KMG5_9SPHN|nr:acyltransferase family protein [Novosphingobium flavum]MBC2666612.1 acyltransferase family protein [Novosphingobium flavum]
MVDHDHGDIPDRILVHGRRSLGAIDRLPVVLFLVLIWNPSTLRWAYDLGVVLLAAPALLFFGSRFEPGRIGSRIAALLGDASFALYAIHSPVAHAFQWLERKTGLASALLAIPYILLSITLAVACVRWFDQPVRLALRRATRKTSATMGGAGI